MLICQRCFGAASAKDRLDVVIRDAINAGDIPGPRYLANAKEIARRVSRFYQSFKHVGSGGAFGGFAFNVSELVHMATRA